MSEEIIISVTALRSENGVMGVREYGSLHSLTTEGDDDDSMTLETQCKVASMLGDAFLTGLNSSRSEAQITNVETYNHRYFLKEITIRKIYDD